MSLERLGRELAREQDELRALTADRGEVRARLQALPARALLARPRRLRVAALCGALAAAAALGLLLFERAPSPPAPLLAKLESSGRLVTAGAFVEAPASAAVGLRFSDGTRLRMSPGARARLVELDAAGAHVLLESGRAHVEVVPRARARFRVSAGPFVVRVTGTRFDVRWDPEQDRFEVVLARGEVELSGCVFGRGYRMRPGQDVHASCKRGIFDVVEHRSDREDAASTRDTIARAEAAKPVVAAPPPAGPATEPARRTRSARSPSSGDFEQRCQKASVEQLAKLADEARYARELANEAYALRLLRRRFAGTPQAALAAFALGRLEFDGYGGHRKAAEWFDTYLREQPSGPLAREARGRLIEATLAAGDLRRARTLALSYLSQHPQGPHAELAHRLQEPTPR